MEKLAATYDHKNYEQKWWSHWMQGGWFHAEVDPKKKPYTVLIPPPNVTSRLHMGHGLNCTIQDILIRWKRMQGYNACWLPGTDHAGIATQMMVEKALEAQGTSRKALGRKAFVKRCEDWREENGGIIIEQLKRLGASCDWEREAYTMSPELSYAVRKIFVDLYEKGLIYRGERLVNWDPVLQTAVSDDEVEAQEVSGSLWYLKYPLEDAPDTFLTVATTRPETMFGDVAVAVHPDDARYQHLIGKRVLLPFVQRPLPIIADEQVRADFGSGCVKITPAHDPNDFAMGKRHQLPFITVMAVDGSLNAECPPPFCGLERYAARKLVVQKLKDLDLLEKVVPTKHSVPLSERSKVAIEPRLSQQWYVKMQGLAEPAIAAAHNDSLRFYPNVWKKTYLHWLENIQDWCISRQLWWGHRIPIWYCQDCNGVSTGLEDPSACSHCQSEKLVQDEDVLDTWFSSWLWPLSPFGWPEKTAALDYFFPSEVLVTAPEIIYLWVARMVMVSFATVGKLPFHDIYFNATICDKQGRKFSKTLGNGIDPLEIIDKHGADAARYTCVSLAPLGARVKMAAEDFDNGARFINKIWNAARFLLGQLGSAKVEPLDPTQLDLPSKWLLWSFLQASEKINRCLASYQINEAVETLFHISWRCYCDWGLEAAKDKLDAAPESRERAQVLSTLVFVFDGILRLMAPVLPFVSEEIWHKLPAHPAWDRPESLVIANFPEASTLGFCDFSQEAAAWEQVQNMITAIRSLRTQAKVPPKEKLCIYLSCEEPATQSLVQGCTAWVQRLAGVAAISFGSESGRPPNSLVATGKGWTLSVPVGAYLDLSKEKLRLEQEVQRVAKIVSGLQAKLGNEQFCARAPQEVLEQSQAQLANMQGQLESLQASLAALAG